MSTSSFDRALILTLAGLALAFAQSCTPNACLRQSDCAPAFTCTAGACVVDPSDAGPPDGAIVDAGPVDAGPIDAGSA